MHQFSKSASSQNYLFKPLPQIFRTYRHFVTEHPSSPAQQPPLRELASNRRAEFNDPAGCDRKIKEEEAPIPSVNYQPARRSE